LAHGWVGEMIGVALIVLAPKRLDAEQAAALWGAC
jgi:hypothetical protein